MMREESEKREEAEKEKDESREISFDAGGRRGAAGFMLRVVCHTYECKERGCAAAKTWPFFSFSKRYRVYTAARCRKADRKIPVGIDSP